MTRIFIYCLLLFVASCNETPKKELKKENVPVDQEWISLSPKDSFEGWHIFQNEEGTKSGWTVEEGVFTFDKENSKGKGNKSLVTDALFTNFEIEFEWKLSPNSNSGFMWGVSEDPKYDHPFVTGPEIQIIDADVYGDDPEHQVHTVGALYDMIPPTNIVAKKAGAWNKYNITIDHSKNEGIIVLNGSEINRFPLSGDKWDALVKKSKFATMEGFGKFKEGRISLQDHPGVISYKNIKIKRL